MTSNGARRSRWDPDARGVGSGDATSHIATLDTLREAAASLREAAAKAGWVAEDPEAHLLPHLRRGVEADWASLSIEEATTEPDATFVVETHWVGDTGVDARAVRIAAYGLIAAIAESTTAIHERPEADAVVFEVVTGVMPEDSTFATHGHTLRLQIVGAPRTAP